MNPKSFIDLYDDGLQAEEIESEKKRLLKVLEQEITQLEAYNKEVLVRLLNSMMFNN